MYFALVSLTAVALGLFVRRLYRRPSLSTLVASSLALLFGFVVLSACVAFTYVWGPARHARENLYVVVPALVSFGTLFVAHLVKHKPKPESVIAALVLCGFAAYFLGLFVMLLTACVHGDCI